MIILAITLLVLSVILWVGHYGRPEKVNPAAFRSAPPAEKIMRGAEPFALQGHSDVGFLLIHGFEDSPFTLKALGETLHAEGHSVFAPLLPGHGTTIHDFKHTRYEHWYDTVNLVYTRERPKFKKFFIVGFSMGGNLGMRLAVHYAHRMPPTGLILISAPVALNGILNGKIILKDWRLFFSGIFKEFITHMPKKKVILASEMISPWVGYSEAFTSAPLHSFKLNIGRVRPYLKYIRCPACLIQATNDRTVSSENLHYIFRRLSSREKRAFLFQIAENVSTRHVLITHQETRSRVFHYIENFVRDTLRDFESKPDTEPRLPWYRRIFSGTGASD